MSRAGSVLIVEDDESLLFAMEEALTDAGYVVKPAADGHLAIERLQTFAPDVIVLDLLMPFVNGFEVLEWLKEHRPRIPVVLASDEDVDARALGVGVQLAKPFTIEKLIDAIERARKAPPRPS